MTQKLYLRHCEFQLGQAYRQSMLLTKEEDLAKMIYVLFLTATEHQDIVDVGEAIRKISKDRVHHPLESVPCVPEAEGQVQELKHPKRRDDCCLMNKFDMLIHSICSGVVFL